MWFFVCLWQKKRTDDIDKLIISVKKNGAISENISAMAALLSGSGRCADCAIIGCTDLTPLALGCGSGIKIIDSARAA